MGVYDQVKQALQDVVAPEIKALQGEIRRLDEKIDAGLKRLDEKIDSFRAEFSIEIRRLDEKIDIAIQIRERLAALEAKVAALGR